MIAAGGLPLSDLPVESTHQDLPFRTGDATTLLAPSLCRSRPTQTHYLINVGSGRLQRLAVDLSSVADAPAFMRPMRSDTRLPLGFADEAAWRTYCTGPHTDHPLEDGRILVGCRAFNRYIVMDPRTAKAELWNPNVNDDFVSCTNHIDANGEMFFAAWPLEDTHGRTQSPASPVRVRLLRTHVGGTDPQEIWSGVLGDFLHVVAMSADRRFLVATEMGVRPRRRMPSVDTDAAPDAWRACRDAGIVPSATLVVDLERGREWRINTPTATTAHVEFDPEVPNRCYISAHNIALDKSCQVLFGPGELYAYDLLEDGPKLRGTYSAPDFHRVTSHQVFRAGTKKLIAITGYTEQIFLLDADTMEHHRTIPLFEADGVNTADLPFICVPEARAPYGVAMSADGRHLYVTGSGTLFVVETDTGRVVHGPIQFHHEEDDEFVTGHLSIKRGTPC